MAAPKLLLALLLAAAIAARPVSAATAASMDPAELVLQVCKAIRVTTNAGCPPGSLFAWALHWCSRPALCSCKVFLITHGCAEALPHDLCAQEVSRHRSSTLNRLHHDLSSHICMTAASFGHRSVISLDPKSGVN